MSYIGDIYERIDQQPYDIAFVVSDFLDCGDHETIKKSLARLEKKGKIRRIIRGVYDRPSYSTILKEFSAPSLASIADALARNFNWDICPSGDTALNGLGLSTQVPARETYISSGPYRKYEVGNRSIEFKHTALKEIAGMSNTTAIVIQALKALGKDSINEKTIRKIGLRLNDQEKEKLKAEARKAPIWMYPYLIKISGVRENV